MAYTLSPSSGFRKADFLPASARFQEARVDASGLQLELTGAWSSH